LSLANLLTPQYDVSMFREGAQVFMKKFRISARVLPPVWLGMRNLPKKLLLLMVLPVCLLACQGGEETSSKGGPVGKARPPVLVEVWEARLDTVADRVESIGTLVGNESVTITAKVTEQVVKIHFEDGQMTKAGAVLVELEDLEQLALTSEADANLSEAILQLERLKRLGSDISTGAQIDVTEAKVKASRARLQAIKARADDRQIRAPFDGQLGFRRVSIGALVTPGTVITELDDIRLMKLDFSVPETRLAMVQVGNTVSGSSSAWPGRSFSGEVVSIGSRVDPATRAITVRAIIDNADLRLRPGMLINVELLAGERTALVLPEQALIQVGGKSMVYLVDDELKAQQRPVVIGKRVRGGVVIVSGIEIGESVVVNGQFNLRPGVMVSLHGVGVSGEATAAP
jgi:membrane fusion protein (multidrug efflux system)